MAGAVHARGAAAVGPLLLAGGGLGGSEVSNLVSSGAQGGLAFN
eukprot:SAG31_NODE_243_length_19342_cov_12.906459_23_plen_44_part_00